MKILFPLALAWLAGVLTVIAFFMSVDYDNYDDVEDDIFENDDWEDKDE